MIELIRQRIGDKRIMRIHSLVSKMMLGIAIPVSGIFLVAGLFITNYVTRSTNTLTADKLEGTSDAMIAETEIFITENLHTVNMMAQSNEFIALFSKVVKGVELNSSYPQLTDLSKTMRNIQNMDSDSIISSFIADIDTEQLFDSNGNTPPPGWNLADAKWYQDVMLTGGTIITEPYVDTMTKELVSSAAAPVYQGQDIIGIVGIDISLNYLNNLSAGSDSMIITQNGLIVQHKNHDYIGKNISEIQLSGEVAKRIAGNTYGAISFESEGKPYIGLLKPIQNTGWFVLSGIAEDTYYKTSSDVRNLICLVFGGGVLILIAVIYLISKNIVSPIRRLEHIANKIADGELNLEVEVDSSDEIGRVAAALKNTVERLGSYISYIDEISEVLDRIAVGDIRFRLKHEYTGEFLKIKDSLTRISDTLSNTISHIRNAAGQVESSSVQISAGAQSLSYGSMDQESGIKRLSVSLNEVSKRIKDNVDNTSLAREVVMQSVNEVKSGTELMQKMVTAMNKISDSSVEIGKIIKTIDDIAFQTNILALNAAVEAARAGTAGKGFAVVADEVRNLASKSAEAAKSTSTLIEHSKKVVEDGTQVASQTAGSFKHIEDTTLRSIEIIEKVACDTEEEAQVISDITENISEISDAVQSASATAKESADTAQELSDQAHVLTTLVEKFTV